MRVGETLANAWAVRWLGKKVEASQARRDMSCTLPPPSFFSFIILFLHTLALAFAHTCLAPCVRIKMHVCSVKYTLLIPSFSS